MEFSYSQTENFEMEKLSSDTGYFKKPVEINRGLENPNMYVHIFIGVECLQSCAKKYVHKIGLYGVK